MPTSKPWDGEDRRISAAKDHDTLIELVQILRDHVKHFETHMTNYEQHLKDDAANFKIVMKALEGIHRVFWVGLGVFFVIQALPKVVEVLAILHKAGGN